MEVVVHTYVALHRCLHISAIPLIQLSGNVVILVLHYSIAYILLIYVMFINFIVIPIALNLEFPSVAGGEQYATDTLKCVHKGVKRTSLSSYSMVVLKHHGSL